MSNGPELRRAERYVVDVEAELLLRGLRASPGVIRDMSHLGVLFVPDQPPRAEIGSRGSLRFALPTWPHWLQPSVQIRRTTSYTRPGGGEVQAFGMEFFGLSPQEVQAVTEGAQAWDSHRMRQYELSARCFVQSEGGLTHYARFGQLLGGTRNYLRLSLPPGGNVSQGTGLRLKISRTWLSAEVERITERPSDMEMLLRIQGWGRDFFLHEARNQASS